MTRHLIYKHKTTDMKDKRVPKIALNSSQSYLRFKRGCHKDSKPWLNHWRIEELNSQNIDTIKIPHLNLRINCGVIKN